MIQEDEEPEDPVERERVVRVPAGFFAAVLRDRVLAGFFAAVLRDRVPAGFFAAVLREREAAGFAAVLLAAVDRAAVGRGVALLVTLPSSAATRWRRPATSFLRSSRTFRSPIVSRKRLAA
jgi:hypothetical protein